MIETKVLCKHFGRFVALSNVNLRIKTGRVTGIIGPNGSGKSTLIKCFLGLVRPTSGELFINGREPDERGRYRQAIGYMPQAARFPQDLTGHEVLSMLKGLRRETTVLEHDLIERFGLGRELDKRIRTLSGGTRQKLGAVIACMYDPDLLIFDEPTAGLDPASSIKLKNYIASVKLQRKTVILTTHIISDLEELADDIVLLVDGKVHYDGEIRKLKLQTGHLHLETAVAHLLERGAA